MFISGGFLSCVVPFLLSFFSLLPKARVLALYSGTFEIINPLGTWRSVFPGLSCSPWISPSSYPEEFLSQLMGSVSPKLEISWPPVWVFIFLFESSFVSANLSLSFFCCFRLGSPKSGLDKDLSTSSLLGRWFQGALGGAWGSETGKAEEPVQGVLVSRWPLSATGAQSIWVLFVRHSSWLSHLRDKPTWVFISTAFQLTSVVLSAKSLHF